VEETRRSSPQVQRMKNVNALNEKHSRSLKIFVQPQAEANKTLNHVDELIGEIARMFAKPSPTFGVRGKHDRRHGKTRSNIDVNLKYRRTARQPAARNVKTKEFTNATIKGNHTSLIRATNPREHKPGEQP